MILRSEPRRSPDLRVLVAWQDASGNVRRCKARCVDVSEAGFCIETIDALPAKGLVDVQSETFSRLGHATVRYCQRHGMKYSVGLEFSSTLILREHLRHEGVKSPGLVGRIP